MPARSTQALLTALGVFLTTAAPRRAGAADCSPPTGQSTCLNADTLWLPVAPSRFIRIGSPDALSEGGWSFGVGATYASRPIMLRAPSPDPTGREVPVVDELVGASALVAVSPVDRLETGIAVPVVLFQRGTELAGITSQQAEERRWMGLGDPRLSASYTALRLRRPAWSFAGAARLDATLPVGNEAHFAGEPGPVVAPSLLLELRVGPFVAAAESGLRIRSEVELGGTVIGTQWASTLGAAVDVVDERLTVAGEAIVLLGLAEQDRTLPDGGLVDRAIHVPAEWMVSLRTALFTDVNASVQLGAGGAIPLSHERRREADGDTSERTFAGVTTPAVRVALTLRFVLDTNASPAGAAPVSPPPRPPPARPGPAPRHHVPFRPPTYYVPR